MKQYAVVPAYMSNYHVVQCDNGKVVDYDIVAYYELDGYCRALERQGYAKADFVPKYEAEFKKAEAEYLRTKKNYEDALANALQISDEEAKRCRCLKDCYTDS
jgi:hypothetical protein